MKIFVQAKATKKENVEKIDDRHFVVSVKEPPIQGRANDAIIRVMAKYFGVPRTLVRIASGHSSRRKILEIGK